MSSQANQDSWPASPASLRSDAEAPAALAENVGLASGDRLGSYELLTPLGDGGMGMVFRARHVRLKKDFALKVLSPSLARDREAIRRFETEALGRLDHGHLVRASDAGVEGGTPFVVMELLDGMDLAKLTKQRGPWPIAEACEAVRQAALGLQHAFERGLVHRDIKPSNLWLTPPGGVKVLDLGLARLYGEDSATPSLTATGMVMGTPDYMAPEQILDSHTADTRADLYSLGCTLFHLLSGEPPFGSSTHPTLRSKNEAHLKEPPPDIRQRRPEVSAELVAVLERLLAKQPEDRYQTPTEAAAALEPFAGNARLESLHSGNTPSPIATVTYHGARETASARRNRRWRRGRWIAAAVLLAGAVAIAAFLARKDGPAVEAQPEPPPAASEKIQVLNLDVKHFATVQGHSALPRLLGKDSFLTHQDDRVTVEARLSRPAYVFSDRFPPGRHSGRMFPRKRRRAAAVDGSSALSLEVAGGQLRTGRGRGLASVRAGGIESTAAGLPGLVAALPGMSVAEARGAAGRGVAGRWRRGRRSADRRRGEGPARQGQRSDGQDAGGAAGRLAADGSAGGNGGAVGFRRHAEGKALTGKRVHRTIRAHTVGILFSRDPKGNAGTARTAFATLPRQRGSWQYRSRYMAVS